MLGIPSAISDEEVLAVSRFRSRGRLPVVTWRWHLEPVTPIAVRRAPALLRCSQPLVGLGRARCEEDEAMLLSAGVTVIFDARPFKNAVANLAVGKG